MTEVGLPLQFKTIPNILTNSPEILIHIQIRVANNIDSQRIHVCVPFHIRTNCVLLIMLGTIQLYNKILFCNIEIHDVSAYDLLPMNPYRKTSHKIIPQVSFFFRHIPAQISCVGS